MENKKDAGIASAVQYKMDNTPLYYYHRKHNLLQFIIMYTFFGKLLNYIFKNKLNEFYNYSNIDINKVNIVDQIPGACFIERIEIIKEIGYVTDNRFPFFFNDVDQCKCVRDKKYKIFLIPSAKIIHDHSSSFKQRDNLWISKEFGKSMIKFYRKHHKSSLWLIKYLLFSQRLLSLFLRRIQGNKKKIKINKFFFKNILKW